VNAKDQDGSAPLHAASCHGHVRVVNELLEHGSDVEATTISDSTPLHFACSNGQLVVVIELLGPNDIDGATTSILGKRKSRGADTEAKDCEGDTPLRDASSRCHLLVVKALMSGGADILAINDQGELPIYQAVREGHSEVANYLPQHFYVTTCHLPLLGVLRDLTWIGKSKQ
jgi:ankyrin repeat protein